MSSAAIAEPAPQASRLKHWTGHALSGIAILFLALDAGGKLAMPRTMAAYSPPQLGWPTDVGTFLMLGATLLVCTLLYAIPRTAVFGAVLLTAYLGGAVATHVRVGSPLFSHILFGVYLGLFVWGGLWLRDARLRAIFPLIR